MLPGTTAVSSSSIATMSRSFGLVRFRSSNSANMWSACWRSLAASFSSRSWPMTCARFSGLATLVHSERGRSITMMSLISTPIGSVAISGRPVFDTTVVTSGKAFSTVSIWPAATTDRSFVELGHELRSEPRRNDDAHRKQRGPCTKRHHRMFQHEAEGRFIDRLGPADQEHVLFLYRSAE